jgi:O-antigen/teichoic acid export membrane protein
VAPLLAALVAIPPLIERLGVERFGVLALAWTVIGYFSLFDLGIGRAVTRAVSENLGRGHFDAIPAVAKTALTLMGALGIAGGVVLAVASSWLVESALNISPALRSDVLGAFFLLALSVPIVVATAGLRGLLEAYQRFALLNAIRVPTGIFMFVGPLIVSWFSTELTWLVASLAGIRCVVWGVHWHYCRRAIDLGGPTARFDAGHAASLVKFGGWMTVTNVVGPLMVYMDRFLIGAMVSVAAVSYYVTPYEIVTKLWIVPGAMIGVLFPAFTASLAHDRQRAAALMSRAIKYVFVVLFPVAFVAVAFAREGLHVWLNEEFSANGTRVLQWLAVGVYVNSVAQIPSALIQGAGRPDITARLHLLELPFYLMALYLLTAALGIEGTAIAWSARVLIDALLLAGIASRLLPGSIGKVHALQVAAGLVVLLALIPFQWDLRFKAVATLAVLSGFALWVWRGVIDDTDRSHLKRLVGLVNR